MIIVTNPERFCVSVVSKIVQNASSELVPTDHAHRRRAFRSVSFIKCLSNMPSLIIAICIIFTSTCNENCFKNPTFSLCESFQLLRLAEPTPQDSAAAWCPFNRALTMCLKVKIALVEGLWLLETQSCKSREWGVRLYYLKTKKKKPQEKRIEQNSGCLASHSMKLMHNFCSRTPSGNRITMEVLGWLGFSFSDS